jgi:allantoate deiminase
MTATYTDRSTHIIARCREIAAFTQVPGETTRLFLTPPMHEVHALVRGWMEDLNMTVHVDAIGNMRGLWAGTDPTAPRFLIGSHLDTVPNAGAFDGILGVVLGLAVIEELQRKRLPFGIEILAFSEEEGVRYAKPFLGSLAFTGKLGEDALNRADRNGITMRQAIQDYGLDPTQLPAAVLTDNAFAYLEFHIEQGPILERENTPLGVVEALVGQTRMELIFTGHANHAGTTPMSLRHDAMVAAADWIVALEEYASAQEDLVATVGKMEVLPGAANIIPGRVIASFDVRHPDDTIRTAAVDAMTKLAKAAAASRGVKVAMQLQLEHTVVRLDPHLVSSLHKAANRAGFPARNMTSGAGHDAMILAPLVPSVMLFLRSPGGLSHHPDENVLPEDVEAALATAMEFVAQLRDDRTSLKDGHA